MMVREKPHVVVFFGGEAGSHDLSTETGYWACQYLPREHYRITPVQILPDGNWQVPLGSLPQRGPVNRMMEMLFRAVRSVSPTDGLQRLLSRPVAALASFVRGKGGDDGALHGIGQSLQIPVIGSCLSACQQTYNKHLFSQGVKELSSLPESLFYTGKMPDEVVISDIREKMLPPLFVKPVTQEGSFGIEEVANPDDLAAAVRRVKKGGDIIVQPKISGREISMTLFEDNAGRIRVLPATAIAPRAATYYDHLAKRRPGRVTLSHLDGNGDGVLREAETIARNVYERLGMSGQAAFDMIADGKNIQLLEVNSVPVFSAATPLGGQLKAGGVHPASFFDSLVRRSLG